MTNINVSNVNRNMIQGLMDQFQADGVKATGTVNSADKTLTLTLTNQAGQAQTLVLGLPDLDNPNVDAKKAAEELDKVADKIESMVSSLKASGNSAGTVSASTLFDIYALIQTLQKVAQQQRKNASEMRQLSHQNVQNQLQASATDIRKAGAITASCGMAMAITSTVSSAVSVGMAGFSIGATAKANTAAGLGEAQTNLSAAKVDLKEAENANASGRMTSENIADISEALQNSPELQAKFDAIKPTGENANGPSAMDTRIQQSQTVVESQKNAVAAKTGELATAESAAQVGKNDAHLNEVRDQASKGLKAAKFDLKQGEQEVLDLKMERSDDIMAVKQGLDEKIAQMPEGPERAKLEAARDNFMGANKEPVVEGLKAKVETCKNEYAAACRLSTENGEAKRANAYKTCGDVIGQIGKTIDSFESVRKGNAETEQQARAKENEAYTEEARAELDAAKELYDDARQMQNSILEMRKAIEQMDAQLAQTVMRA